VKKHFAPATYAFAYRQPPPSGNFINGMGETAPRRARPVFHGSGLRRLEWEMLELFFLMTMPFRLFWPGVVSRWILRQGDGPQNRRRVPVADEAEMAGEIKRFTLSLGAGAVGISRVTPLALFEGYETPFRYAISIAYPMDYVEMENVTRLRGGIETMRCYIEIAKIAVKLAAHIRAMGWPARAYSESSDVLHIPQAIESGIGQLGKHGSLINRELGANFRLATVLTDLPLAVDQAVDIGVDDLCLNCQRCTLDCPPRAISDSKQMVRGVERWYVDFDRCIPYFVKTFGCGICIQVCPWSVPGRGPSLSHKLLAKRDSAIRHQL
jgi:Pyruvate/2-oxoacid:ferredoxin oxidoreductase delta subunit